MLRHIVLVTFKPEATEEEREAVKAAARGFAGTVPEVRALRCGDNVGRGPNHHDFAIVADFDDMAAFRRYIDGPAHQEYVAGAAKAIAKLAAIQHEW